MLHLFLTFALAVPLRVTVNQGQRLPEPIVINNFEGEESEFVDVIKNDLQNSGLFNVLENTDDWNAVGAHFAITGSSSKEGNSTRVCFKIHSILENKVIINKAITFSNERRIAHQIADVAYKTITGDDGYFDTKLAFVALKGRLYTRQQHTLATMDQDGHNVRFYSDGQNLLATPQLSPDGKKMAYLQYYDNKTAGVRIIDFNQKTNKGIKRFSGMSFAPRFSFDGKKLVFSLTKNGSSAIYTMNVDGGNLMQLTQHKYLDTSPCFSRDGQKIIFTSNRGYDDEHITEQIYVMNVDGSDVRRISFGDGKYSQPRWNPKEDLIAFTKQDKITFSIGTMHPDGSKEEILYSGYLVENCEWAPNGRRLVFSSNEGSESSLKSINLNGHMITLRTPCSACDPSWSAP